MARTRQQQRLLEQQHSFFGRHGNVYVYVPNLIGYLRIAASLYAFGIAMYNPTACFLAYFASFVCDELDGRFARKYNQCSTLGSVLDMVTDRVATSCLLAILAGMYPRYLLAFMLLLQLDIFSHWFQMYSTLAMGASTHKDIHSRSFVVRAYYRSRLFMGFCCICCEVLYLALYLLSWQQYRDLGPHLKLPAALHTIPQLHGLPTSIPLAGIVALLSVPGFAVKQVVNVIQLRTAAQQMVLYDRQQDQQSGSGKVKL